MAFSYALFRRLAILRRTDVHLFREYYVLILAYFIILNGLAHTAPRRPHGRKMAQRRAESRHIRPAQLSRPSEGAGVKKAGRAEWHRVTGHALPKQARHVTLCCSARRSAAGTILLLLHASRWGAEVTACKRNRIVLISVRRESRGCGFPAQMSSEIIKTSEHCHGSLAAQISKLFRSFCTQSLRHPI